MGVVCTEYYDELDTDRDYTDDTTSTSRLTRDDTRPGARSRPSRGCKALASRFRPTRPSRTAVSAFPSNGSSWPAGAGAGVSTDRREASSPFCHEPSVSAELRSRALYAGRDDQGNDPRERRRWLACPRGDPRVQRGDGGLLGGRDQYPERPTPRRRADGGHVVRVRARLPPMRYRATSRGTASSIGSST